MFKFLFGNKKSVDALLLQAEQSAKNALKETIKKQELKLIDSRYEEINLILRGAKIPQQTKDLVKLAIEKVCSDIALGKLSYIQASKELYKIEKKITELQVISSHI